MTAIHTIPNFPSFSKLSLEMRDDIIELTAKYPPYHDYSLGNLYCWNTDNKLEVSKLNNNLVVKFTDYTDDKNHFLSFLGDNLKEDTITKLIDYSQEHLNNDFLRYVPESSITDIDKGFDVEPIRDDFDYIYSTDEFVDLAGNKKEGLRREYNNFYEAYGKKISTYPITKFDSETYRDIKIIFDDWLQSKPDPREFDYEFIAINKMFHYLPDNFITPWGFIIKEKDKPIGFFICELGRDDFATCHFTKGNMKYEHIHSFLFIEACKKLAMDNITKLNFEPDLGIQGLRTSKERKHPTDFLKKYKVIYKKAK